MFSYTAQIDYADKVIPDMVGNFDLDKNSPDYGACYGGKSNILEFSWASISIVIFAYFTPQSQYYGNELLKEIIDVHLDYSYSDLSHENLCNLKETNWSSPGDTAFAVDSLAPLLFFAKERADICCHAKFVQEKLSPLVETLATAVIGKGFHTPNHRWEMIGSLALAKKLFPHLPIESYVNSLLAEEIDINEDGEYTERSTGIYNAVCNRGLLYVALFLEHEELLEFVERNLNMMTYLFNDDGSVVTLFSSRQDSGKKLIPITLAPLYFVMGHLRKNKSYFGYASYIMDNYLINDGTYIPFLTFPFLCFPELRDIECTAQKFNNNFIKCFNDSNVWRERKGLLSATIGANHERFCSIKFGEAQLNSIKIASPYFGKAIFNADKMEMTENKIKLYDSCTKETPKYFLPLGRKVTTQSFREDHKKRDFTTLPSLSMDVDVTVLEDGFEFELTTYGGVDELIGQFELDFSGAGIWESENSSTDVDNGQTTILLANSGTFRVGNDAITVTGGSNVHQVRQMRGSEPEAGFRVVIPILFKAPQKITIQYGKWSPVKRTIQKLF